MSEAAAFGPADRTHMTRALDLARKQAGRTGDNPAVGCVLVKTDRVVGEGVTADGGRPHAEELALAQAGSDAAGAVAYVTLEPCAQRSSGGLGCSVLLAKAGVARVVFACADPHPLAAARGVEHMRAAGIEVQSGLFAEEAWAINAAFFERVAKEEGGA